MCKCVWFQHFFLWLPFFSLPSPLLNPFQVCIVMDRRGRRAFYSFLQTPPIDWSMLRKTVFFFPPPPLFPFPRSFRPPLPSPSLTYDVWRWMRGEDQRGGGGGGGGGGGRKSFPLELLKKGEKAISLLSPTNSLIPEFQERLLCAQKVATRYQDLVCTTLLARSRASNCPANIGTTRATPAATPLEAIGDGVEIWGCFSCSKGIFFHLLWS